MAFVYILLLRSKNIFQSLKLLEEGTHQAFYNSVLLVSEFVSLFMHSISGNTCWILLGRGSGTADKNGLLSVQTPQLSLIFLSMHVLW